MTARGRLPRIALGLALGLAAPSARALDPGLAVTQYVQSVWRAPRDLPHDNVTAVAQTRDGYVWVGTTEGLARFDGVRSVVFTKASTPQIRHNWIRALREDRQGRLWIGTFGGGLTCLEDGRFSSFGAEEGLPADVVYAFIEDGSGLLVGTQAGGVYRLRGDRFEREPGTESIAAASVRAFALDRGGTLWVGTEEGLFHRAPGKALVRQTGLPDEPVISLAAGEDAVYAGTERGLARIAGGSVSLFTRREGLSHDRVWSLAVDADQNVWIGTDGGGLDRLTRGRLTSLSTRNGLTNDYVWALFEDREHSLWIGTNGGGLNQLRNGRVATLAVREGLPSDFTWSVLRLRDGGLLVGTEDAGVARVRDGVVTSLVTHDQIKERVRALLEDRQGRIWLGSDLGLFRLEGGRLQRVPLRGLERARVVALAEDRAGVVWIGTSIGLWSLDGDRLTAAAAEGGAPPPSVSALLVARDGSLWASATAGLWHREGDLWVVYGKEAGLPNLYVTSVLEAPDGTIWAATLGGLARFRKGRFAAVTGDQGLRDDNVMSALLADDGALWLGTNRGLFEVPLADLEGLLDGTGTRLRTRAVGLEDGMRTLEVNHGGSARYKDADGRLWFATRIGLVSVSPTSPEPPGAPPPVRIEEATADGVRLGSPPWRLPAGTRRIDVHFTALGFRSADSIRMRYRLEGLEPDWVDAGPDRTAHYTSLPHGRYVLHVAAAGAEGAWDEAGTAAALEIEPRLYEALWFRLLVGSVVVAAGSIFYFARLRLLRRQKADLERLVIERTAEVAAANERLAQLVREDGLTGVASRRRFDEALEEEWRRAQRLDHPLALVLVDVDWFKAFNDRLGHPAGDACLKAVASAVAAASQRAGELVARYGGEEFALLLPGVAREGAQAVAENVRERVQDLAIAHPDSITAAVVTVSAGVAVRVPGPSAVGPADLVAAADQALYAAKQGGRNRVEAVD